MTLFYIILLTIFGGAVGVAGALAVVRGFARRRKIILYLVSFAAGSMITAAFFDLIPETFEHFEGVAPERVMMYVFGGIILFYIIEQFFLVSHCHNGVCDAHKARQSMVIVGDTVHNFLDGVAIAAAFLVSHPLGFITAVAVLLHEIPQEIGDVGALLQMGMKRSKVVMWNFISALATIAGGIGVYIVSGFIERLEIFLIALAAGGFIYIATADLLPEAHNNLGRRHALSHTGAFFVGAAVIILFTVLLRH